MANSVPQSRLLVGLKEILAFLKMSKPTFYDFVQEGLPAAVINGRWYAHADNLERWFQRRTLAREKQIPADAE